MTTGLPERLPSDPLALVAQWLDESMRLGLRNPTALALSTVGASGRPSVRFVLLKHLAVEHGYLVFYTNYGSRKARELDGSGHAAAAMYWEGSGRQLRFEGAVEHSPGPESDVYFGSRPRGSQLNAWASEQSRPLADPAELDRRLERVATQYPDPVPRPPFWGGYRLWLDSIELWSEGRDRFHQRVRYERELGAGPGGFEPGPWRHARLQP